VLTDIVNIKATSKNRAQMACHLEQEITELKQRKQLAEVKHKEMQSVIIEKNKENEHLQANLDLARNHLKQAQSLQSENEASIKAASQEITFQKEKLMEQFLYDKYLHNKMLEIKGNIRVFCRIRPILSIDVDHITSKLESDYIPSSIKSKRKMEELKSKASKGEHVVP